MFRNTFRSHLRLANPIKIPKKYQLTNLAQPKYLPILLPRFLPIRGLATPCVLICDDDIEISESSLRTAYDWWKTNPHRVVGFFPRNHKVDPITKKLVYSHADGEYSMVSTKLVMIHGDYLRAFTCQSKPVSRLKPRPPLTHARHNVLEKIYTRVTRQLPHYITGSFRSLNKESR